MTNKMGFSFREGETYSINDIKPVMYIEKGQWWKFIDGKKQMVEVVYDISISVTVKS